MFDLLKQLVIPDQSSKDRSPFCVNLSMMSIKTYRHRRSTPSTPSISQCRLNHLKLPPSNSIQFRPIPAKHEDHEDHEAELRLRGASSSCGSRCLKYIGLILQSGWSHLAMMF